MRATHNEKSVALEILVQVVSVAFSAVFVVLLFFFMPIRIVVAILMLVFLTIMIREAPEPASRRKRGQRRGEYTAIKRREENRASRLREGDTLEKVDYCVIQAASSGVGNKKRVIHLVDRYMESTDRWKRENSCCKGENIDKTYEHKKGKWIEWTGRSEMAECQVRRGEIQEMLVMSHAYLRDVWSRVNDKKGLENYN